jgi:hypothetical protein
MKTRLSEAKQIQTQQVAGEFASFEESKEIPFKGAYD